MKSDTATCAILIFNPVPVAGAASFLSGAMASWEAAPLKGKIIGQHQRMGTTLRRHRVVGLEDVLYKNRFRHHYRVNTDHWEVSGITERDAFNSVRTT